MLEIVAVACAAVVLLPLVVQAGDEAPFHVQVPGERAHACAFDGRDVLLGTTATCELAVVNTGAADISVSVFVDPASVRVTRCPADACTVREDVARTDPDFERFVGAWVLSAQDTACEPGAFAAYDGADHTRTCPLGVVAGLRSLAGTPAAGERFVVGVTMLDDGTDQSRFGGWDLHFDLVVRAAV